MTLTKLDFLRHAGIDRQTLTLWIEAERIVPVVEVGHSGSARKILRGST